MVIDDLHRTARVIYRPPTKLPGQQNGRRRIGGSAGGLDVAGTSGGDFNGAEKSGYGKVARREIPFKRLGGRLIFLKAELDRYFEALDGCTVEEALANDRRRRGEGA